MNENNKLPELMEEYLHSLEFAYLKSKKTVKAYRINLKSFCDNMFSNIEEVTIENFRNLFVEDMLIKWLNPLKESGMAVKSVNQKISTIRSFYRFLVGRGLIAIDITKSIPLFQETDIKEKESLTIDECWELLDKSKEILESNYNYENLRNHLCITLLFATGIRVEELHLLDTTNFNLETNQLILKASQVKGKKKGRIVSIPQQVIELYNEYLELRLLMNDDLKEGLHQTLFISKKRNRLSTSRIRNMVYEIVDLTSISKHVTPHIFRHSYATIHANSGDVDIFRVSKALGHATVEVTKSRYIHSKENDDMGELNPIFNRNNESKEVEKETKKVKPTITKDDNVIQLKWA